jgi:polyhydroxybutyrate depolymerase
VSAAHRTKILVLACAAVTALAIACSNYGPTAPGENDVWSPGTASHSLVVGSLTRTYFVHVPARRRLSTAGLVIPWPLVIVLHGSSGDGPTIEHQSGMDSLAEAQRFLVAYPNGTGGAFGLYPSDWNAGTCCGGANRDNIDDLGFISALIAEVTLHLSVDPHRVYVGGFSSGGYMAYHAGCQLATTIAAIGVISGSLADDSCAPAKPVPLFAEHGTDDPEVPYDQDAPPPPGPVPNVADTLPPSVRFWSSINGCAAKTAKSAIKTPSADVAQTAMTSCTGADVDFYRIQGGTHGWPGGPDDPGAQPPMNEMNASLLMWQFFIAHTR